jgi:hypothetical protein
LVSLSSFLETFGFTFIFSSAVLIDRGITAAELEVENARSCASFIIENVGDNGLFAKNLIIMTYMNNIRKRPTTTVIMYAPSTASAEIPIFDVIPAIRPKAANGAKRIAQDTTFIVSFCMDSNKSRIGLELCFGNEIIETPTMIAKTIMLNISPDMNDTNGLLGITPTMLCGMSCMLNSALSICSTSSIPKLSLIKELSIKFPGSIAVTRRIPIVNAIIVVMTKYTAAPNPSFCSCSRLPADVRPLIIDAKINGMMII